MLLFFFFGGTGECFYPFLLFVVIFVLLVYFFSFIVTVSTCFVYRIVFYEPTFFLVEINGKWMAIQKEINLNVIKIDHNRCDQHFYNPKEFHLFCSVTIFSLLKSESFRKIVWIFFNEISKLFPKCEKLFSSFCSV